jgi:arylsulfatase A-like enzyme
MTFNIFFITSLKINHYLRTPPWSVDNLLMDAGALAGIVLVAIISVIFYRIVKERAGKPGAILRTVFIVIISLIVSGVFFKVSGNSEVSGSSDESFRPVILITLDTVRADHLSVYGYNRETSPNIAKFSEDGIIFENTVCQVPITRPSHFSILTGRYPSSHGLTDNFSITPEDVPLLSEHMAENGYTMAAFVSAAVFDSSFNTNFGFQEYFDTIVNNFFNPHFVFVADLYYMGLIDIKNENSAVETNQVVFKWLEKNGKKQFFIWLHYFDPHTPYTPPEKFKNMYTDKNFDVDKYDDYDWEKEHYNPELKEVVLDEEIVKHAVDLYDAEIRSMDEELGKLFDELRRLNVYEKSLIIVTADHGESFEHGYYFDHGDRLYEGLIRVPFILKLPGRKWKGKKINTQVETVDIAPTVLEILSLNPLQGVEGKSLVGLMSKEEEEGAAGRKNYAYSQTPYRGGYYFKAKELQSVRSNDWKLIYDVRTKKYELFNLYEDPAEKNDVASSQIAARRELELALSKFDNAFRRRADRTEKVYMDQTTLKQIKSLGYVK